MRRPVGSLLGALAAVVLGAALILRSQVDALPASTSVEPAPTTSILQPTPQPAASTADSTAPADPRRCPGGTCVAAEDIRIDGTIVSTPQGRFQVGRPGDVVVVGDFDCDGAPTPALLRRSSGEVFVFAEWATAGELAVRAARTVPGAADLLTAPLPDGCATLEVRLGDGRLVPITTAASR